MADLDGNNEQKQKEYYTDTPQTAPNFFLKGSHPSVRKLVFNFSLACSSLALDAKDDFAMSSWFQGWF